MFETRDMFREQKTEVTRVACIAALMDFLCVGLPIFFLRNLQANIGRKICLLVLLGLGLFTAACAILRTCTISFANQDSTWHSAPVAFFACLEQNIGIIVASVPALHQLYTIIPQKVFRDSGKSYPHLCSLNLHISSGCTDTSNGSHNERIWLGSRGSQSMRMMSNADGSSSGSAGPVTQVGL
ncbi:MAG: hypothetical protein ASARMPRED_006331 [Alectoria sarmentosa]|nr:MAG: hypothetical protein ASARMPRED_006331 [Alectoria sarmentosa]